MVLEELFGLRSLGDADCKSSVGQILPLILGSKESGHFAHEVNSTLGAELGLEELLGGVRETEVLEIVNV